MPKRKDATYISNLDPFHSIVPYVMPKRTEAEVSITENFDITELNKYLAKYNKGKEESKLKLFHCICYAVAKTIHDRPKMNRFIAGRRFWQRNEISLSFVAKQKFDDKAEEVLMFLKMKDDYTVEDLSKIINGDVKKARKQSGNDLDKTMSLVGKMPRFILVFFFWIISRLEYHGMMPDGLSHNDPNYSTVLLSNLGSIGAGAPYHHLSNYGTCSIMMTIGTAYKDPITKRDFVPITAIIDERIADGFYYAKSIKLTHHLLENPKLLFNKLSDEVNFDVENKPTKKKATTKAKKTTKKK